MMIPMLFQYFSEKRHFTPCKSSVNSAIFIEVKNTYSMFLNRQMLLQTHFQSNSDEYPKIPKSSQAYFLFDQHGSDV